jgi:phage shock protein A
MIRFLTRALRYLGALFNAKLDETMDPRVLVEEAIADAQRQHRELAEQAAAVIGNQRELEIKIARVGTEARRLRDSARQALVLADRARSAGDLTKSAEHEQTARLFANQLASRESTVATLTELHAKAEMDAAAARRAVEQNAHLLQRQLNERSRLLGEIEAAKLAERMADALRQVDRIAIGGELPSLGQIQERVDRRLAQATGRGELAASSADLKMIDVERSMIDREGEERLAEIRKEIGLG